MVRRARLVASPVQVDHLPVLLTLLGHPQAPQVTLKQQPGLLPSTMQPVVPQLVPPMPPGHLLVPPTLQPALLPLLVPQLAQARPVQVQQAQLLSITCPASLNQIFRTVSARTTPRMMF